MVQKKKPAKRAFTGLARPPLKRGRPPVADPLTPKKRKQKQREKAKQAELDRQKMIAETVKTANTGELHGRSGKENVGDDIEKIQHARAQSKLLQNPNVSAFEAFAPDAEIVPYVEIVNGELKVSHEFKTSTLPGDHEDGARRQGTLGSIRGEGPGYGSLSDEPEEFKDDQEFLTSDETRTTFAPRMKDLRSFSKFITVREFVLSLAQEELITWIDADKNEHQDKGVFSGDSGSLTCRPCGIVVQTWDQACAHLRKCHRKAVQGLIVEARACGILKPITVCPSEDHDQMRARYLQAGFFGYFYCGVCHKRIEAGQALKCSKDHTDMLRVHQLRWVGRHQKPLQCDECHTWLLIV